MKKSLPGPLALILLAILLGLAVFWIDQGRRSSRPSGLEISVLERLADRPAPPLEYDLGFGEDGLPWSAAHPAGRMTLVNFWATWCVPCVEELPLLRNFALQHGDARRIRFAGFTRLWRREASGLDDASILATIERFWTERKMPFPTLVELESATHDAFGIQVLPTTLLIDGSGRVVELGIGESGTRRVLRRTESLLAQERSTAPGADLSLGLADLTLLD